MPTTMIAPVNASTGADAMLRRNGMRRVRIMCTIRVCESRPSMNQPDWNSDWCATSLAPNQCHISQNVVMSNTELTGPIQTMKRPMSPASHLRGWRR